MSTAKEIFIKPIAANCFLLITVLKGRGRAYWLPTKTFPTENDVKTCLASGEGLPEGGIDALLAKVHTAFLEQSKNSYRIDEFKQIIQSHQAKHSAQ